MGFVYDSAPPQLGLERPGVAQALRSRACARPRCKTMGVPGGELVAAGAAHRK